MTEDETNRRTFLAATAAGATGLGVQRAALGGSAPRSQAASGLLVFTYDDGPNEDYTQAYEQAHKPEGVPGCSGVPSARVGGEHDDADLSHGQIQEMAGDGWEFMTHGVIHRALAPIELTENANQDDRKLYTKYNFHGKEPGDTIEIVDANASEVATITGRGSDDTGEYIIVDEGIENAYAVADGAYERYTKDVVRSALADSQAELESENGVEVNNVVMPYSGYGEYARELAGEYYDAVANAGEYANTVGNGLNPVDGIELPNLSRRMFESDQMTDQQREEFLDRVASEDVLGILGGHTWRTDLLPPERIRDTIQMARDRNIEIVTLSEALARLGYTDGGTTTTTTTTTNTTSTTTPTTTSTTSTTTPTTSTTTTPTTSTTTTTSTTSTTTSTPTTSTTTSTTTPTTTSTTSTTTPSPTTTTTPSPTTTQRTTSSNGGGGGGGGGSGNNGGNGDDEDDESFDPGTGQSSDRTRVTIDSSKPSPSQSTQTTTETPIPSTTTVPDTSTTTTTTTTPTTTSTTATPATSSTSRTSTTPASTASDGQPGFGWLASLGGLAGAAAYALKRATDDEEE